MNSYKIYRELLDKFISFKSISTDESFKSEIDATAEFLKKTFESQDFKVKIIQEYGNPIVLAEYIHNESLETCLIYGHYDVQPAEKSEGWDSEPFQVEETENKLIARGIVDNKGQTLIHIASVFSLIQSGKLKYNIKFMLEGDEETGSPLLPKFVEDFSTDLECDFYMISDGTIIEDNPIIEASFRGGFNAKLEIRTAKMDMHSGMYGGGVPNPIHLLSDFVSSLYKDDLSIAIPNFYDDVEDLSDFEIENNKSIPFSAENLEKITGVKKVLKENDFDFYSAVALRPSIQVTGINSGYTGVGFRNGIPATADVRINFRLAPSQNHEKIINLFEKHVKDFFDDYVDYKVEYQSRYTGIKLDLKNKFVRKAKEVLMKSFQKEVLINYVGGGLPIVTLFNEFISSSGVLAPLGNEDCNMHAVNENYDIDLIKKGIEFSEDFFGSDD